MEFREHAPPPALAGSVECMWTLESAGTPPAEAGSVAPDGCVELVFGRAGTRVGVGRDERGGERALSSFVLGLTTRAHRVTYPGPTRLFGVRLRPLGALKLLGTDLRELVDRALPPDDVVPRLRSTCELTGEASLAVVREAVSDALTRAFCRADVRAEHVAAALERIQRCDGRIDIGTVAREAGLSARQLDRDFERYLGLAPKLCARIARFRAAFQLANRASRGDWAGIAVRAGYADQAHLTRDFREFAGLPPDALRRMLLAVDV